MGVLPSTVCSLVWFFPSVLTLGPLSLGVDPLFVVVSVQGPASHVGRVYSPLFLEVRLPNVLIHYTFSRVFPVNFYTLLNHYPIFFFFIRLVFRSVTY